MSRSAARVLVVATALLSGALLVTALLPGCSIDHGIEAQLGFPTIRGTVTFKGEAPANTEWVKVFASQSFPPADAVELAQAWSGWLDLSDDRAEYEIELPAFGEYATVAAVWKGAGEPFNVADILGIHGASFSSLALPDTVRVTPGSPVAEGVDISADLSLVNRGAVIRGRITYLGGWPARTELVAIAVYENRPQTLLDYVRVAALNASLPLDVDFYDYRLAAAPGTYRYVVVLWKARGTSIFAFQELGHYEMEPGAGVAGELTVARGDTARSVDIIADFRELD